MTDNQLYIKEVIKQFIIAEDGLCQDEFESEWEDGFTFHEPNKHSPYVVVFYNREIAHKLTIMGKMVDSGVVLLDIDQENENYTGAYMKDSLYKVYVDTEGTIYSDELIEEASEEYDDNTKGCRQTFNDGWASWLKMQESSNRVRLYHFRLSDDVDIRAKLERHEKVYAPIRSSKGDLYKLNYNGIDVCIIINGHGLNQSIQISENF